MEATYTPAQETAYPVISATVQPEKEENNVKMINTSEAAKIKGYSAPTIRKLCREGKLDFVVTKRKYYVITETNGIANEKFAKLKTKKIGQMYQVIQSVHAKNRELASYIRELEEKLGIKEEQSKFNFSEE